MTTHPDEARRYGWLESKTPRQEFAYCLDCRGHVLVENLRFQEAAETFAYSADMEMPNPIHYTCVEAALNRWYRHLRASCSEPFPDVQVGPIARIEFPHLPSQLAERMEILRRVEEAINVESKERLTQEARRKAKAAQFEPIEYRYEIAPEQAEEMKKAEERFRLVQAQRAAEEERQKAE